MTSPDTDETAPDRKSAGFKDRTRLAAAREQLLSAATPHERTERLSLIPADGRALAETVTSPTAVPDYERAAMDGWAVRARDTFGSSDRSPGLLRVADAEPQTAPETAVGPDSAVRVHTGGELPDGANAVVMTEETNVEERFIDSLEDVETAIRDSRSHEVRAPVLDRDHPAVDTLSRLSYHAEADPVEAAGVSLTLSEATEQTETFGEFESMANEDHGESVLLDVSEQSREIATQLSDSQEEAAERLNEHIQRAGDMFGIVSYHFYCPDCESDDVTSRLELRDAGEWFCPTCRSSFPLDGGIPRHRIRDELVLDIWDQLWIEKDDQRREVYESIEDQKAELEEREFEQRREEIRTAEERIKDIRTRIRDLQTEAKAKQGIVDEIGRLMVKYERLNEQKKEQFRTDVADAFERIDAETERALAETEGTIQDRIEEAEQEAEEKAEMLREEERQREREKVAYEQARADERAAKEQAMADERAAKEQAMANDRTGAVAETIAKTHSNKPSPRGR